MSDSDQKNLRSLLRLLSPTDIEEHSELRSFTAPQKLAVGAESFSSEAPLAAENEPDADIIAFKDFREQLIKPVVKKSTQKDVVSEVTKALSSSLFYENLTELKAAQLKLLLNDALELYLDESQKEFFSPTTVETSEGKDQKKNKALVYSSRGILINKKH